MYDSIKCLETNEIASLETKNLLVNAIIQSNALSLISMISSAKGMLNNLFFAIDDVDPDIKTEMLKAEPLLYSFTDYCRSLPNELTTDDLLKIANNINKNVLQSLFLNISKDNICIFLISVAEFYLLDKQLDFNGLFKDSRTIDEVKKCSWIFERINPSIKQVFLTKIVNDEIFLDLDLIVSLSVNTPLYLNEALMSLNLRNLEGELEIYSESFGSDLRKIKSIQASKNAKIKANKEAVKKEPIYKKLEKLWDKGGWSSKGRGKYSQFAKHILYNDEIEGLEYDAIRNYISKYDKTKN